MTDCLKRGCAEFQSKTEVPGAGAPARCRLLPSLVGAATSAPERSWSQSRQCSHQLPLFFSELERNESPSGALASPVTKDAFGLVGGLRRLCKWPLFDRTKVASLP